MKSYPTSTNYGHVKPVNSTQRNYAGKSIRPIAKGIIQTSFSQTYFWRHTNSTHFLCPGSLSSCGNSINDIMNDHEWIWCVWVGRVWKWGWVTLVSDNFRAQITYILVNISALTNIQPAPFKFSTLRNILPHGFSLQVIDNNVLSVVIGSITVIELLSWKYALIFCLRDVNCTSMCMIISIIDGRL